MLEIDTYKTWAPDGALWTDWAKPVLFASASYSEPFPLEIPQINWLQNYKQDTAIIVDLPGKRGVGESLALARLGYRPVPLYNGVHNKNETMVVNVQNTAKALYSGAEILAGVSLPDDAPPVFMLDSRRMEGTEKKPGTYDNRWCVFPQDMPSAGFLLKHGINNVIVRMEEKEIFQGIFRNNLSNDLSHILFRYQEAGITIQVTSNDSVPQNFDVTKPSQFKSLFYRFRATMGLSRNSVGGFGSIVPYPYDGSGRYYGMG